jgi:predicted KAP-like P-loop ATPase
MTPSIEYVDGAAFAPDAALLLNDCFPKPSIDYSPEYIAWQLSFPGPTPPIAAAAFCGREPVGFVGASPRRLRLGPEEADGFLASFWCVRPGRSDATGTILLLDSLLERLWERNAPVLAFGFPQGVGERLFPTCFRRAGFLHVNLAPLPGFGFRADTSGQLQSDWRVALPSFPALLPELVAQSATADTSIVHICPSPAQLAHYASDPRSRRLVVATNRKTGERAAAWAVRTVVRTASGLLRVPSLDSVLAQRRSAGPLPALLLATSRLWPPSPDQPATVNAPSLAGFDANALRALGIRQCGGGFLAHLFLPPSLAHWRQATATAAEVV